MTTTVSLAARDFIVVGCDSLATTSVPLIFPGQLTNDFFEPTGELKKGSDGQPLLNNAAQIWERTQRMPVDQLPSVTKLYDLAHYKACLLFAGASRVGETTIRNIVETFKSKKRTKAALAHYTIESIANELKSDIEEVYAKEYPNEVDRPSMEIILSGYSAEYYEPQVLKLTFSYDYASSKFSGDISEQVQRKAYDIVFGGQYDVIQRVVFGVDEPSYYSLRGESVKSMEAYHSEVEEFVKSVHPDIRLPKPNFWDEKYSPFSRNFGGVTRLFSDVGSLSEQAGIDFVHFLVSIMIKAQEFSSSLPTVGGNIHVAMLTKNAPFRWISRETFRFENEHIPKFRDA